MSTAALKRKALRVHQVLLDYYGSPDWSGKKPPLDELISTILSQNTNDRNRDRAFANLLDTFPTWGEVRDAQLPEVIESIRSAGLANQKGQRIQQILRDISRERGSLDLQFLKEMTLEDARTWLTGFKGVGPKTAAIVLLFSLGKAAFPVDTHVHRVSGRLGLLPARMTAEAAHTHLEYILSPDTYHAAHLNMIRLGREVCKAQRPQCSGCVLKRLCNYYRTQRRM
jgi:endonuclease-3